MNAQNHERAVGSVRTWEIVVGVLFLVFGAIVVWDSQRLGAKWGSDGPQAGYFPFYIGCLILLASAANLVQVFLSGDALKKAFVEWRQLRQRQLIVLLGHVNPLRVEAMSLDKRAAQRSVPARQEHNRWCMIGFRRRAAAGTGTKKGTSRCTPAGPPSAAAYRGTDCGTLQTPDAMTGAFLSKM